MTNNTINLSRELAELYWDALRDTCSWADELRALLDAEPVPPAGGEPEVLARVCKAQVIGWAIRDMERVPTGTELVDRAHVTQLQAELDRTQSAFDVVVAELRIADTELIKAREFERDAVRYRFLRQGGAESDFICLSMTGDEMDEAVDVIHFNQSTPAAKDGE